MTILRTYIGNIYGTFEVIEDLGRKFANLNSTQKRTFVKVKCLECNNFKELIIDNLKRLNPNCECKNTLKPLINDIGLFIVLEDLGMRLPKSGVNKFRAVIVQCKECNKKYEGNYQSFKTLHMNCECQLIKKIRKKKIRIFTEEQKRIYKIHYGMLERCFNEKNKMYKYYGSKGIKVCDEWLGSYKTFYEWAKKNGYTNNLSIDRIDNSKGYSPENCRWASNKVQMRNRSNSLEIEKVKEIKKLLNEGLTHNLIADIVNTSIYRVNAISSGKSWVDIR